MDLPLCAAWKTSGVTVAGREDELKEPLGLYTTRDGTLYVVDRLNHRVMTYALNGGRNGTQIGDGIGSEPRQLLGPTAVVVNEETNEVYISDYGNRRIQLWSEGGLGLNVETVIPNNSETNHLLQADDIQLDPRSNDILYILDEQRGDISIWTLRAKDSDSSFQVPQGTSGIYVDAQQNVYAAACYENEISTWVNGSRVIGTGPSANPLNRLHCPIAVTVDSIGNMFIVDSRNHRIMRWEVNTTEGICITGCSTAPGNKADQLAKPTDLTFDWKGNLLVSDTGNHRVQRFDLFINTSCGKYRASTIIGL